MRQMDLSVSLVARREGVEFSFWGGGGEFPVNLEGKRASFLVLPGNGAFRIIINTVKIIYTRNNIIV